MKKTITTITLFLLLGACSISDFRDLPSPKSVTPTLPSTMTLSFSPSPTIKPVTPTAIKGSYLNIKELKPGLYIAYSEVTPNRNFLSVISWDGIYQGRVMEFIGGYGSDLSPDKHFWADLPYITDLDSGNQIYYEELENCGTPNWSPDSKKLSISCPTDNFHHNDIYIFSVQDRSKVPVTNCEFDAFSCGGPSWSPDGHWLAFYRGVGGGGTSKLVGLHILDMTCSSGLANCWDDEDGIYTPADFSWSPNAEFLAAVDNDMVFVFKINDGELNLAETYKLDDSFLRVAWLGNNNELLVLDGRGTIGYVISRQSSSVSPLTEAQNRFFNSHSGAFEFIFTVL